MRFNSKLIILSAALLLSLATMLLASSPAALAQSDDYVVVSGEVYWLQRLSLPEGARLRIEALGVDGANEPARIIAWYEMKNPGNPPIAFELKIDPSSIRSGRSYSLRAEVRSEGRTMFVTDQNYPVLQDEGDDYVEMRMVMPTAAAAQLEQDEENASSESYTSGGSGSSGGTSSLRIDGPETYKGVLPCADCPGIDTWLNLFPGGWYTLSMDYQDSDDTPLQELGRWTSSYNGNTLLLHDAAGQTTSWRVLQGKRLRLLDSGGRDIQSSAGYELQREVAFDWFSPRLNLRGIYRYMADAGSFTECLSKQRWPVAMVAGNQSLERAYSQSGTEPGEGLLVELDARLMLLPQMDGTGYVPTLVPLRYLRSWPGGSCADFDNGYGGGGSGSSNDDDDDGGYDEDYEGANSMIVGTRWGLVRLGDDALPSADERQPYMILKRTDSSVSGNGGCNGFGGNFELDGDDIRFSDIFSTQMYCEGRSEIEQRFFRALTDARSWKVTGAVLDLYDADDDLLARFAAQTQ